jgi:hypothetical protein
VKPAALREWKALIYGVARDDVTERVHTGTLVVGPEKTEALEFSQAAAERPARDCRLKQGLHERLFEDRADNGCDADYRLQACAEAVDPRHQDVTDALGEIGIRLSRQRELEQEQGVALRP